MSTHACRAYLVAVALAGAAPAAAAAGREAWLEPGPRWSVVGPFSRGHSYYSIVDELGTPVIHARYEPPASTVILGAKLDHPAHFEHLTWRWRVLRFPVNADERVEGRSDNAASVYVTFVSTFKKHVIKYVWSTAYAAGTHWDPHDSSIFSELHIVVREGPPPTTGEWREETVALREDYHRCFGGDPNDEPPPVGGLGVLSDGDGTKSPVEAEYAAFHFFD
jgi:hypothetical protein